MLWGCLGICLLARWVHWCRLPANIHLHNFLPWHRCCWYLRCWHHWQVNWSYCTGIRQHHISPWCSGIHKA
jgi:hypothetical protein